jgi:serine/threonine-protein kinase HipA
MISHAWVDYGIAKFPSINDTYDVGLWEQLCNLLAKSAGIHTAPSKAIDMGGRYHTYLSKRFDRSPANKRIHFASAMTLLGFEDGDNATSGKGCQKAADT